MVLDCHWYVPEPSSVEVKAATSSPEFITWFPPTIPGSGVLELSDISTLPIPGFPMNKKAEDAKRYYAKEDEGEFNKGSENFSIAAGWKEIETANPPVTA